MEIGFIGVERMGASMARRLLRDGQRVAAWKRTAVGRKTNELSVATKACCFVVHR